MGVAGRLGLLHTRRVVESVDDWVYYIQDGLWESLDDWVYYMQDGLWESLDDWVYYIRSFGNSVEFCFAVFLFFNGAWILLFESGGTIRAVMMLVHAYFNIWCEAK